MDYLSRTVSAFAPCVAVAIGWTILTWIITPIAWRMSPLSAIYAKQSSEGKLDLNARVTAATHAAIVFVMSAYVIVLDEQFDWRDVYTSVCVFAYDDL